MAQRKSIGVIAAVVSFFILLSVCIFFPMHLTFTTTKQEFCKCPYHPDPDIVLPGSSPSAVITIPPQDPHWGDTPEGIEAEKKRQELIEQTPEYKARIRLWVDKMEEPFKGIGGLEP